MERDERPAAAASRWLVRTTATRYFALAGIFFVWAFIWLAWAPKPYAWIATVLWIVIAAVFAAQGLRLRKRAQAAERTERPGGGGGEEASPGVTGGGGRSTARRGRAGRRPAQPVHRPHHRIPLAGTCTGAPAPAGARARYGRPPAVNRAA